MPYALNNPFICMFIMHRFIRCSRDITRLFNSNYNKYFCTIVIFNEKSATYNVCGTFLQNASEEILNFKLNK